MERSWLFVALTLLGTVAGQMLLKHAIQQRGPIPGGPAAAAGYVLKALTDPLVIAALTLAFIGALAWIAALSRLELSLAYPFMSLAFVLTTVLSSALLREQVSTIRWTGMVVLVIGLVLVARS